MNRTKKVEYKLQITAKPSKGFQPNLINGLDEGVKQLCASEPAEERAELFMQIGFGAISWRTFNLREAVEEQTEEEKKQTRYMFSRHAIAQL